MNDPHVFVALYAGQTIDQARIVGASTDPELVRFAASRMLRDVQSEPGPAWAGCRAYFRSLLGRLAAGLVPDRAR